MSEVFEFLEYYVGFGDFYFFVGDDGVFGVEFWVIMVVGLLFLVKDIVMGLGFLFF